jgi:hypothetical protein
MISGLMEIVSAEHSPLLLHMTLPSGMRDGETLMVLALFKQTGPPTLSSLFVEGLQRARSAKLAS